MLILEMRGYACQSLIFREQDRDAGIDLADCERDEHFEREDSERSDLPLIGK